MWTSYVSIPLPAKYGFLLPQHFRFILTEKGGREGGNNISAPQETAFHFHPFIQGMERGNLDPKATFLTPPKA